MNTGKAKNVNDCKYTQLWAHWTTMAWILATWAYGLLTSWQEQMPTGANKLNYLQQDHPALYCEPWVRHQRVMQICQALYALGCGINNCLGNEAEETLNVLLRSCFSSMTAASEQLFRTITYSKLDCVHHEGPPTQRNWWSSHVIGVYPLSVG